MRRMLWAAAAGLTLAGTGSAADPLFVSKPIDTTKYLVTPTDQAAGFFSGLTGTLSRTVAGTIENSGYARTINNLFGTKARPDPVQAGGLPAPSMYQSTRYQNSFTPRMPTSSTFQK
jgi:hypothetical protein